MKKPRKKQKYPELWYRYINMDSEALGGLFAEVHIFYPCGRIEEYDPCGINPLWQGWGLSGIRFTRDSLFSPNCNGLWTFIEEIK